MPADPRDGIENRFRGAKVVLGVTGSIAAYKAAELIRWMKKADAEVRVLMTPGADKFITPLTLGTLAESEVYSEIFPDNPDGGWTQHVELGRWADVMIVAPATANTLSKLAHGRCDSMLTATALSARCPQLVCPAMDHDMYRHPATQDNLRQLRSYGVHVLAPEYGSLASGLTGVGRLPELEAIVDRASELLNDTPSGVGKQRMALKDKKVVVTAGPTREAIDPVRFISNHSTGTTGFALAGEAARAGGQVTLITGPTTLNTPVGVNRMNVTSTEEMHEAVMERADADVIIMSAAVSDFRPTRTADAKIKKSEAALTLELERTPDILRELGARKRNGQILVGFALETDNGLEHARRKLQEKNLDWIVLNNPSEEGAGFGYGTNRVTLLNRHGDEENIPLMDKRQLAGVLIGRIVS